MKLASFLHQDIRSYGIVKAEGVVDLGRRLGDRYADLKALLAADGLDDARRYAEEAVDLPLEALNLLPVIDYPDKILCLGMNYAEKRTELDQHNPQSTLFVRFPYRQLALT